MAKEVPTIEATHRDRLGSRYSKRLRAAGRLPAVIYGHGSEPLSVHVDEKITVGALKRGLHVMNLTIAGKTETCLVKDLQFGFLGDDVIHMDLARVNLDEVVTVTVSLVFYGAPEAAKKSGTVVVHELA
ncbi:MAG: 50S ribosomal protein L25, partial [bacterium]